MSRALVCDACDTVIDEPTEDYGNWYKIAWTEFDEKMEIHKYKNLDFCSKACVAVWSGS